MMIRGVHGTDALETINAAATLIASAENRIPQASIQKRRWGSFWSLFQCFGSHINKRIGPVLVPEMPNTRSDAPAAENISQPPSIELPFVAPPSSPASFLPSEPPSATLSPTGLISLNSVSANMYSPGGPASIFVIGPYAHETQLVSPPFFSTFTTEPSTAPYTPPPELVHLTTPSSPEVPFARLLEPSLQNGKAGHRDPLSQYEFQYYQLHPGSPLSHLISPSSGISGSGTSSPFPDLDCAPGHPLFPEFRTGNHPMFLNIDKMVLREWESCHGSGAVTPDGPRRKSCDCFLLKHHDLDITPVSDAQDGLQKDETVVNHRVSFEITAEEVVRCVDKKPATIPEVVPESVEKIERAGEENPGEMAVEHEYPNGEISNISSEKAHAYVEDKLRHLKSTITLGSSKEFNFDNVDGENSDKPNISSDWWANKKILGEEGGPSKKWSFFPMVQTGVS